MGKMRKSLKASRAKEWTAARLGCASLMRKGSPQDRWANWHVLAGNAAGAWQAARSLGEFTLVGCTVAPEFRFEDFRLLADDPQARAAWPLLSRDHADLV